ncbi:MAG TPA: DegV family protein [Anaerolineae bacterium]|nr:DegV family protein [Anaerolineae bacterium]
MSTIRIVTDSSAHLTPEEIEQYGITIIPLRVRMGRKLYKEVTELSYEEYFRRLQSMKTLPTSESPQLQEFIDLYYELSQKTDHIISIHTSRKLNKVVDVAHAAASTLRSHTRITVIDSETLSRGLGMIVLRAAEMAQAGESAQTIGREIRGMIPAIFLAFLTSDLHYLEGEGRLRKSQAFLGAILGIRALVETRDGDLLVMDKARDSLDAVEKLYEYISEFAYLEEMALLQHNNVQIATALMERLREKFPHVPIFTDVPDATLSTFLGSNVLGVIVREAY